MRLRLNNYEERGKWRDAVIWAKTGAAVDHIFEFTRFISRLDSAVIDPPPHLPQEIESAFTEAAKCLAAGCWNASAAMFRLCLDLATRPLLPDPEAEGGPNSRQRRDLGLRLPWLIEHGRVPSELKELSSAVREDGNDGVHAGNLSQVDAEDLKDFTSLLLERLFSEPERIALAAIRRAERRAAAAN